MALGLAAVMVAPAQAASAAVAAPAATVTAAKALQTIVVPTGGSATIAVGTLPAGTTAVTFSLTGVGAWRDTVVSGAIGSGGAKKTIGTARPGVDSKATVILAVPSTYNGKLTLWSSLASVKVSTTITAYTTTAPTITAPVAATAPNASNTGVPTGTKLTVHNGDLTITKPGAVINALDVRGFIRVKAANVTIKNSIVRGAKSSASMGMISNGGFANLKVIDTELFPSTPSPYMQGIIGSNFTLTRVEIHGVVDSVHLTGGNVTIEKSYLYDNLHYLKDPLQGGKPSHDDSIQIQVGSNIKIIGNTIKSAHNAAVMITQDRGDVSNVTFANNSADGGACTINIAQKSYGPISGIVVTDNKFGRNTTIKDCAVLSPDTTKVTMARNVYVPDLKAVTVKRG